MNPNAPIIRFLENLNENSLWFGVKVVFLIAFVIYIAFAIVIISQVRQMSSTISTGFEKVLGLLSWLHLGLAALAFIWALVIL